MINHAIPDPKVFILMGVAGTGKSTLGAALADATGGRFFDGDDFHPESNLKKMAGKRPLTDRNRRGWLEALANLAAECAESPRPTFIACSALKESYRGILRSKNTEIQFIFLTADPGIIRQRIEGRYETGKHFMPPELLDSQLETLEPPEYALEMDVAEPISKLVTLFIKWLSE